jgi:hypothetical protein
VLIVTAGLTGTAASTQAGVPAPLTIAPAGIPGQVEIAWPSAPDTNSIHTLLVTDVLGAAEPMDARVVPNGPGATSRTTYPVVPAPGARFFRLKTRAMVPVLRDDFERPGEGPHPMGTPPLGAPWTAIGLGGRVTSEHAIIEDGDFVTDRVGYQGTTYLCQELPDTPCLLEADFRWEPHDGIGGAAVLTIACSPTNEPNWIHQLIHIRIARKAVLLDFMEDGHLTNHRRSEIPELPLGTSHNCRVYLDVEAQAVVILLNNENVLSYHHPLIRQLGGRFVFWEHYYHQSGSEARLHIERVFAAVPSLP